MLLFKERHRSCLKDITFYIADCRFKWRKDVYWLQLWIDKYKSTEAADKWLPPMMHPLAFDFISGICSWSYLPASSMKKSFLQASVQLSCTRSSFQYICPDYATQSWSDLLWWPHLLLIISVQASVQFFSAMMFAIHLSWLSCVSMYWVSTTGLLLLIWSRWWAHLSNPVLRQ